MKFKTVKMLLVVIPASLLFAITLVCDYVSEKAGNATSFLGRWADK